MKYIHAYAWMFATLLLIVAVQTLPHTITGAATSGGSSPSSFSNATPWMGLFIVGALTCGILFVRYKHYIQGRPHSQ